MSYHIERDEIDYYGLFSFETSKLWFMRTPYRMDVARSLTVILMVLGELSYGILQIVYGTTLLKNDVYLIAMGSVRSFLTIYGLWICLNLEKPRWRTFLFVLGFVLWHLVWPLVGVLAFSTPDDGKTAMLCVDFVWGWLILLLGPIIWRLL
jgi:hypothetical protein